MLLRHGKLTAFFVVCLVSYSLFAQSITYSDNLYPQGMQLVQSSASGFECTFSVHNFILQPVNVAGAQKTAVHLPSVFLPNEAGYPDVPVMSKTIAIPKGARAILSYEIGSTVTMEGVNLAPAPEIPKETESGDLRYTENATVFSKNALYPSAAVEISESSDLRGLDIVMLAVSPFQYNPVTKQLFIHKDIRISIRFEGGNGQFGEERLQSIWWEPVLRQNVYNYSILPQASPKKFNTKSATPDFEYIIITPDNPIFLAWADTIKQWRNRQGIRTGVVTLTTIGGNDTTKIRNYIKNAYTTWAVPPVAVLMLGDYSTGAVTGTGINSPIYNAYCASDNKLVDMNYDHMPEMAVGRISAVDNAQLTTVIGKMLSYERNPPISADFYKKPIIAGGWQTERWFILCTEAIFGYLKNKQGKTPTREYAIYSGTPSTSWSSNQNTSMVVNYFGPNGLGYIPATPAHLTDWGGNATRINADLNAGAFILQHRDHGMETGWGEPSYTSSSMSGLNNNNNMLPFVFSLNCLTGKFNYSSNCFAESFTRHAKGALGAIGASEVSYSFVNDAYTWGIYDYMFPDFDPNYGQTTGLNLLPAFANASGKYYLKASSWPYNTSNKVVTYHLFHHFGDVFMRVNSESPKALTVVHDTSIQAGDNSFCMSATPGALICISKNGQIVETALATQSTNCFNIGTALPREVYEVTVTMQNYYRYSSKVKVYGEPMPVHVTYPNGGEILRVGTTKNITWESVLTGKVAIEYSTNNGATWQVVVDSVPAAQLSYAWIVPNTTSQECKIRICDCTNVLTNDASDAVFSITSQYCVQVGVNADWNLVSVPVVAANMDAATLFPNASSLVYGFAGSYQSAATLANGKGYWVRYAQQTDVQHCGEPVTGFSIPLSIGWNLIGAFDQSIATANLQSTPAGIINSSYFGYNAGYVPVTSIAPGKGYWVRATQAGILSLSTSKSAAVAMMPTEAQGPRITIIGANNERQVLYLVDNTVNTEAFDVPPVPPAGVFDVRFANGSVAAPAAKTAVIQLQGITYPVTVQITGTALQVRDAATQGKLVQTVVANGSSFSITDASVTAIEVIGAGLPSVYALEQNYPNPFNPSTDINFSVPEKAMITLEIYNQLGQKVAVLLQEEKPAGRHSIQWNATGYASGIYYCRMQANSFNAVQKMVLMK